MQPKMALSSEFTQQLQKVLSYLDGNQEKYIERLAEAVAIPSISGYQERRDDCVKMMKWMEQKLASLGCQCKLDHVGVQTLPNGTKLDITPALLAHYAVNPDKKTVLVYCHLDVQPAEKEDGWNTDPFTLTQIDGKLYGRGASDDKGPATCWLNVLEAMIKLNIPVPVNIKFLFEGMEEFSSYGMDKYLPTIKDTFLKDVDYVCIADTRWLGTEKPCVAYGLRGLMYLNVEVTCAKRNLHSGVFGGAVHEAMTDLIALLDSLVDVNGKILIDGIYDDVAPLTDAEIQLYENVEFDEKKFAFDQGISKLIQSNKIDVLMHTWRYPSLSIHGITGADHTDSMMTSIYHKVTGKFSIRLVPNMTDKVYELVKKHLLAVHAKRGSPNTVRLLDPIGCGLPVYTDFQSQNFTAACRATKFVYGVEPDAVRQGGCVPICAHIQKALPSKDMVYMTVGRCDDNAHGQNEKLDISNFMNGMKVMATYLFELSQI